MSLEQREIVTADGTKHTFDFLVIDSPADWRAAQEVTGHYDMPFAGQSHKLRFNLLGVSLADWEAIEQACPIPKREHPDQPDTEEFTRRYEEARSAKRAAVIEISTGKKIPDEGGSKSAFLQKHYNPGEVESLYAYIQNILCATQDGMLLTQYQQMASKAEAANVLTFDSFDSWQKAAKAGYVFRMQRPTEDVILEFPLKNITTEDKLAIELETREPEPPKVPDRDPTTKKWIPNTLVPDYNDAGYLMRLKAVLQKRTVLFMNACLPFTLPGQNNLEQYEWLSQRLVGDVVRLKDFIENDLCGYRSRLDFFSVV